MATSAYGDTFSVPSYYGEMVESIPNVTPALNLIGKTNGLNLIGASPFITVEGLKAAWVNEPQRGVTNQSGALEGATPTTRNNLTTSEYNVLQIWQESFEGTYSRISATNWPASDQVPSFIGAKNDFKNVQLNATLKALAKAINYQMHRGTRTYPANNSSARQMGGWQTLAGTTADSNYNDYGGSALTKANFRTHLKNAWNLGALRGSGQYVMFCDAVTKDAVDDLFGTARVLPSATMADLTVDYLKTNYGTFYVVLDPDCKSYSFEIVDLAENMLVGMPTIDPNTGANKGIFFVEELARTGSSQKWQVYGEMTLKFGHANHIVYGVNIGGTSA